MSTQSGKYAAVTKAIRNNFDRGAAAYCDFEGKNSFFSGLAETLLGMVNLPENPRILDVGCGTGASTAALRTKAGAGALVVGLDLSMGMLKAARTGLGPDANLVCLDGTDYGGAFRPGFDAVVYNAVLFMLPDAAASLDSALQLLKKGGFVLIASLEKVTVDGVPVPEILISEGHPAGRHSLSPGHVVKELLKDRFRVVETKILKREMTSGLFMEFYGMEPMSAGLFPRLPFSERLLILQAFDEGLRSAGKTPYQEWELTAAVKE